MYCTIEIEETRKYYHSFVIEVQTETDGDKILDDLEDKIDHHELDTVEDVYYFLKDKRKMIESNIQEDPDSWELELC